MDKKEQKEVLEHEVQLGHPELTVEMDYQEALVHKYALMCPFLFCSGYNCVAGRPR